MSSVPKAAVRAALFGRAFSSSARSPSIRRRAVGTVTLLLAVSTAWVLLSGTVARLLRTVAPVSDKQGARIGPMSNVRATLRAVQKAKPEERANVLAGELAAWKEGPPPATVAAAAAACTPRDAADALLRGPGLSSWGVVDVGANGGYPVTDVSLRRGAAWVVSIEPDERNFKRLRRRRRNGGAFLPVAGAAGANSGRAKMRFHKSRDDFSCFNCLDTRKSEVFEHDVNVYTVDQLVMDATAATVAQPPEGAGCSASKVAAVPIRLLKTDTQGHERAVLEGARRLLAAKRVHYVMMEFDPKLFHTRDNAMGALREIFAAGLQCVQLALAGVSDNARLSESFPFFGARAVTNESATEFYEFVKASDKYTDVLCSSR
ncbi:hypothetical protein BWQ96_05940 [Gracilariopsis chorda]|uniref:Methyltransferase FkbM domain-containing protein n=1 Tax=Gracilariopsis chorda TaxID=448386 RepID=A0A2V3IQG2_9FLOR|nr:hypothetical protein BWQ96_05940 [Gracilariopsis chorda]|eukprot:PXF44313.1 hypothetical protein BWQ96_05940 [Gracilariopsis chorda]